MAFPMGMGSFGLIGILGTSIFIAALGIIVFAIVKSVSQWHKNNQSPRLTVPTIIVSKRTQVSPHMYGVGDHHHYNGSTTTYYVTFQVESGDRLELCVSGQDYGMLVEGDRGQLTFQGTRFLSFQRG